MVLQELPSQHQVLTLDELQTHLDRKHSRNKRSREALVSYHLRQGNLIKIRQGLYAVVQPGYTAETTPIDPYLVAGKMAPDAVLAYHTALEIHGRAHSVFERFFFQSKSQSRPTLLRSYHFERISFPKALRERGTEQLATVTVDREGSPIRSASLERVLVDLHDRPELGGGWEEVWRSLETVEYFDLDLVVEYAEALGNRTTAAKVGYFLEQHADALMVDDAHLASLRELIPKRPHYLQRGQPGRLIQNWNLIVPAFLAERSWKEVL